MRRLRSRDHTQCSAWRAQHAFISLRHKCQRMPRWAMRYSYAAKFNIGGFLIWQFSTNSPNHQIKNIAKVSRCTVFRFSRKNKKVLCLKFFLESASLVELYSTGSRESHDSHTLIP